MNMSAIQTQIGGSHYKDLEIQPVEYIHANGIGYMEGNVIKYITRWKAKGGIADLEKAKHYIELLIELETEKQSVDAMEKTAESQSGWIEWNGGECPVDPVQKVEAMLRCGELHFATASRFEWDCRDADTDIIAYRVYRVVS